MSRIGQPHEIGAICPKSILIIILALSLAIAFISIHIRSIPIIEPSSTINTSDHIPLGLDKQALWIVEAGLPLVRILSAFATLPVGVSKL